MSDAMNKISAIIIDAVADAVAEKLSARIEKMVAEAMESMTFINTLNDMVVQAAKEAVEEEISECEINASQVKGLEDEIESVVEDKMDINSIVDDKISDAISSCEIEVSQINGLESEIEEVVRNNKEITTDEIEDFEKSVMNMILEDDDVQRHILKVAAQGLTIGVKKEELHVVSAA